MSEENVKVDKRRIVSKERLLAMERMRQAKAAKALERKNNPEVEQKVVIPDSGIANQEEEVSEDEVPVPAKKVKSQKPRNVFFSNDMEDEIQRYVDACLPPEFSKENRKKQKWEMRKKEIRDEILQ